MASAGPIADYAEEEVFVFPMSFAQQRLWFVDQLGSGTLYNVPIVVRLTGDLDLAALKHSFQAIVQRHEVLRTTFRAVQGQPVQVIVPEMPVDLPLIDLRTDANRETVAQQLIQQAVQQSFDLTQGPLLRLLLLQLEATEHVLMMNVHHIVFDEWSIAVLIQELGALYTAEVTAKPALLPDLPIQYADFTQWQWEWLQGDVLAAQLAYWRQQLSNLSMLALPGSSSRLPQVGDSETGGAVDRGASLWLEIPADVADALKALSQQEGVTLFMTLLAAFQVLLYRYSGQTDIAVGSPISNRNRRELEDLIGFFANSLVLRTNLAGNPTFRSLLHRVRQVTLGAYAHQDVPFEKLVEALQPDRSLHRNPLFQVVFALQNAPMKQLALPGLTLDSVNVEIATTRFDLELYLWEAGEDFRNLWGDGWQQPEGLRGLLIYSTALFEREAITRLVQHFHTLLAAAAAHPDIDLANLPLLSPAEQQQRVEWNQTDRAYPTGCIHQQFEAQVAQSPDAMAVCFGEQTFTYGALNSGSNQLAHYLRSLGVGPETIVGICMEPSAAMVAGLLAILKAGGAYLPLDPSYPTERLHFMLEDAHVSVVLTQHELGQRFDCRTLKPPKLIDLDRDWPTIAAASDQNLVNGTTPDHLAYVMYTSGSTGTPKGVAVPHRAVNRLVCNSNYIHIHPHDRIAQAANLSFDAATFEIWGALLNGAQLIGIDRETLLSPHRLATVLHQQQISIGFLTTALFNQLAQEAPAALRSLRYLLFGGEAVDVRSVRRVLEHGAPEQLLHVYGPTENTTFTAWYAVQTVPADAATIPIGRPIANTQIYLLDDDQQPVPVGSPGEIYIGGAGLARGYLNRPELTAQRFVNSAWGRLYRTGDRARYRSDGNLEFLGRLDDQVKLRGFRIELGEIEAVLRQHPAVRDTIVVLRPDAAGQQRLIAYVVPQAIGLPTSHELRRFLQTRLPDYMLPTGFVPLAALPLTPNGKVDRSALPPAAPAIARSQVPLAPSTAIEATLAQLWTELLGCPVGIDANFFELGGHSLLATQLLSRVRQRFEVQVPLRAFFETPTIANLAHLIEALHSPLDLPALESSALDSSVLEPALESPLQGSALLREEVEF